MSKIFIDTNIFIYSIDNNNKRKQKKSRDIINSVKTGVISTQIIEEFYYIAVKKLRSDPFYIKNIINVSFNNYETILIDKKIIMDAIDCSILNRISFWDALIVTTANSANCTKIYTEHLNQGQVINNVKIVNPFQ